MERAACILGITVLTSLISPGSVRAQDQLQDLQRKSELGADDVERIDVWLKERMADLERGLASDKGNPKAPASFTEGITQLHSAGTPSFKRVFAERAGSLFAEKVRSTNGQLSYALLNGLDALAHPATLGGYTEVLDAPDAAVRLLAVRGIRRLAGRGAPGDTIPNDQIPQILQGLVEAGKRELNDLVLEHTYHAFSFAQVRDEQAKAIVQILEGRLDRLKAGKPSAEAADSLAYARLQELYAALADSEQVRLVRVIAAFQAAYCHRLLHSDSAEPPDDLIRLVVANERLLSKVTSIPGGITAALAAPDAQRPQKVLDAARAWFGTAATPGALTAGRWQVPTGGGLPGVSFD